MSCAISIFFGSLFFISQAHAATPLKAGQYEYKTAIKTKGLPASAAAYVPKGSASKICVTEADLKKKSPLEHVINQPTCKVTMTKQTDVRAEWKMSCANGMTKGTGWINVKNESFDGESNAKTDIPGAASMEVITSYSGKRIGDCSK